MMKMLKRLLTSKREYLLIKFHNVNETYVISETLEVAMIIHDADRMKTSPLRDSFIGYTDCDTPYHKLTSATLKSNIWQVDDFNKVTGIVLRSFKRDTNEVEIKKFMVKEISIYRTRHVFGIWGKEATQVVKPEANQLGDTTGIMLRKIEDIEDET